MRTTKAAVMYEYEAPLRVESVDLVDPKDDQIVVKLAACGVCHTDLSVMKASLPYPPPVVLGHEASGVVEEVGRSVRNVKPGDHVVLCCAPNCGHCSYCRAGHPHLCDTGLKVAMEGQDIGFTKDGAGIARFCGLGGFAERTVIQASAAIPIDRDIPLQQAALVGCAVVTGVGAAINTARIEPGQTVAVFGCGGVGLNVIQGAALAGASRIIAVDRVARKLEWAKKLGATETLDATGTDPAEEIRARFGGMGVDVAFEVIGIPEVMQQAFLSVRRGGKAVVVGVAGFGVDVSVPACLLSLEERSLVGSLYGSCNMARDVPRFLDLYRRGKLKLDELVSRRVAFPEINTAFESMEKGEVARSLVVF